MPQANTLTSTWLSEGRGIGSFLQMSGLPAFSSTMARIVSGYIMSISVFIKHQNSRRQNAIYCIADSL